MTAKLHPTNLDGLAALLPYESELADISAVIAKKQQCNDKPSLNKRHLPMQPLNITTKFAAISAVINHITWPKVPPPPADLHLPLPLPSMPDLSLNDDSSNNHCDMP